MVCVRLVKQRSVLSAVRRVTSCKWQIATSIRRGWEENLKDTISLRRTRT